VPGAEIVGSGADAVAGAGTIGGGDGPRPSLRPVSVPVRGARESARYISPPGLPGVEALHASFVTHRYRPHSHPTWTVATVSRGAAAFELDDTRQRAASGELFVLEPGSVHTGVPAVPGGWAYQVLYLDPGIIPAWAEEGSAPAAARWVVFRDERLRRSLAVAHAALAAEPPGLAVDEAVLRAVEALRPHLAPGPGPRRTRPEHAAVRRARRHLQERWAEPVTLAELAEVARLSRFELARTFRAQVGLPPHAFQLDLRVARARALLATGEPPAAVAATCGFYDQAHLGRVFKRAVGVPPARYAAGAG
jgi:AraC-like DNA-binding protein